MNKSFLDELIEDKGESDFAAQARASLKVLKMLKSKFGCESPARALYQIKRAIRAGKPITASKIKEWGKAVS
jgi:hypothetical protein